MTKQNWRAENRCAFAGPAKSCRRNAAPFRPIGAAMIGRRVCGEVAVKPVRVSGTEHYAEEAPELLKRYESIAFADTHRPVMHLIPQEPCRVLDIGAGTGRDAAGFAAMGHRVVAVEPTREMRLGAMALHPAPSIEWLDDNLPELAILRMRDEEFDVVMLTAVWMHLDAQQRRPAIPNVARLGRKGRAMG